MAFKQTINYSGIDAIVSDAGRLNVDLSGTTNTVKQYSFPIGSITGGAAHFDVYTDIALNGKLQSIEWVAGNTAATGSLQVFKSGGATLSIYSIISGTANWHLLSISFEAYPKNTTVSTTDTLLSGTGAPVYTDVTLNSVLRVVGSSVGASKSGLGLNILYI